MSPSWKIHGVTVPPDVYAELVAIGFHEVSKIKKFRLSFTRTKQFALALVLPPTEAMVTMSPSNRPCANAVVIKIGFPAAPETLIAVAAVRVTTSGVAPVVLAIFCWRP